MHKDFSYDPSLPELTKLIGNDAALLISFIEPFLPELTEYTVMVPENIKAGKAQDVARAFHSLKVNAKIFGSESLHELCKELESKVKSEGLKDASSFEPLFVRQVQLLRDNLQEKLDSLS